MGPNLHTDADVEAFKVKNAVFLLPPIIRILLKIVLYLVQAWDLLCGAIITAGLAKEYKSLLDWLQVTLVISRPHTLSPLVVTTMMAPITN